MIKISQFILIIVLFSAVSCVTTYRIDENEFDYLPISEKDELVFESKDGRIDTLLISIVEDWAKTERVPYRIYHNRYEQFGYEFTHTLNDGEMLLPNFYAGLMAFDWKGTRIEIRTDSGYYNYINQTSLTIKEFVSIPRENYEYNGRILNDVIKIKGANQNNNAKYYIEHLYWSDSEGIVGWKDELSEWKRIK